MESTDNSIRHIHEQRDGDAQFVIHPESNDVFVRTGKEVIASCELGISLEVYLGQLSDLFRAVASWGKIASFRQGDIRLSQWLQDRAVRGALHGHVQLRPG